MSADGSSASSSDLAHSAPRSVTSSSPCDEPGDESANVTDKNSLVGRAQRLSMDAEQLEQRGDVEGAAAAYAAAAVAYREAADNSDHPEIQRTLELLQSTFSRKARELARRAASAANSPQPSPPLQVKTVAVPPAEPPLAVQSTIMSASVSARRTHSPRASSPLAASGGLARSRSSPTMSPESVRSLADSRRVSIPTAGAASFEVLPPRAVVPVTSRPASERRSSLSRSITFVPPEAPPLVVASAPAAPAPFWDAFDERVRRLAAGEAIARPAYPIPTWFAPRT
ncbi:hypothetical protein H9P43_005879 [Blastocladiella emersonii ATCC 22665]|nr:hypothetical protein H9P43_005879 [Blastocladiella emersonii ATCC 22665]